MATKDEVATFSNRIRAIAIEKKINHWEALLEYCDTTDMEPSVAASLLDTPLKVYIQNDVDELNLLKRKGMKTRKLL